MESQKSKQAASKSSKSRQTIRSKQRQSSSGPNETPPVKGSHQRSTGARKSGGEGDRSNSGSRLQNPASVKKQEGRKLARIRNLDRNTADEAIERKKQEELRKQIAIKEQQLKEMTEAAKRLKGRIGSGTLPDIRAPNISTGAEGRDINVIRGDLDTIPQRGDTKSPAQMNLSEKFKANEFKNPQPLSNKNPASGGGLRSQKFQKSQDSNELRRLKETHDARRLSNQSRHSGDNIPLRNKNSGSRNNTLSGKRNRYSGSRNKNTGSRNREGSAGGTILQASRIFENSLPSQAPLRVKNISPNLQNSSPLRASNSRSRSPPQRSKFGQSHSRQDDDNLNLINSTRNKLIRPLPVQQSKLSHSNSSKLFQRADNLNMRCRERIDTLQIDNQALQHRFGLVQSELTKTLREREELWGKFETVKRDCKNLETKLSLQDPVDQENKNLQNSIAQMKNDAITQNKQIDNQKLFSAEAAQKTGYIEAEAKDMILKMERMSTEIAVIDQKCESLNAQKVDMLKEMEHVNQQVVEESKQEYNVNLQNIDIDSANIKLQSERNLLINDLERLTFEYDQLVRDITNEKLSLDQQNNDQKKLITAKVIFNNLQKFQFDRKQEAFKEIKIYSDFERESFAKLQAFYMLAYRLGRFKQKTAIIQWYNNALRPLGTRYQNENLSTRKANLRKMARVFYAWLQYNQYRLATYEQKKQSINLVWEKLSLSAQVEIKRAMTIWKEKSRSQSYKNRVFKRLIALKKKQVLVSSLTRWKEWSMLLEQEVRVELLKREYAHKFFITTLFNSLKQQCFLSRHKRHRVLHQCLKGWKDFIKYQKQFMRTSLSTMKFQKSNEVYMIKVCYDALKLNKEKKKTAIMDVALHEDMDVVIERYQGKNKKIETRMVRSSHKKVSNIVRLMMQRRLYSYIHHWKQAVLYNKSFLKTKFKDQVFQVYRKTLLQSFLVWRRNAADVKKRQKKRIISDMVQENQERERESLEKEQNIRAEDSVVMAVRENKAHKTFKKYALRVQHTALMRWRDTLQEFLHHKRYQDEIIRKMRNRFVRESFDIYKKAYLKSLQEDKNKKQAEYMSSVLTQRLLQKLFDGFCSYVQRHKRAKRYLNKMLTKLDVRISKTYIRHWNAQSKLKREQLLELKINDQVNDIDDRNKNIGQKEKIDEEQSKQLDDIHKLMVKKARKLLGNYMQRYYSDNTQWRFRMWKEAVRLKREQQQTIRKMLFHLKRSYFTVVKNAMKTHVSMDIQRERIQLTREKEIETEIHQQSIIHSNELLAETREKSKKSITQQQFKQGKHEKRFGKAIEVMARKNITTLLVSKKRRIFESWQHAARQQRAFILCVVNVLEKSIWMKGFHCIREGVRDMKKQDKFLRHMNQITIKLAKNYMISCFNRWKLQSLKKVCNRGSSVMTANEHTVSAFNYHITQIKDQNTSRVFHYLETRLKANIFRSWRNIKNHLKIKRIKEQEIQQMFKNVKTKRALQKMFLRTETTKRIRNNFKIFNRDKAWRLKRMVWDTLLVRRTIHTDLATTISNLEKLFRDKNYIETFKTLQAFAASKRVACNRFKKQATIDIKNLLTNIHMNRLKRYFSKYRAIIKTKTVERKTVKKILLKIDNSNQKDAIRKWREWMEGQVLAQEMNESGPITEQVFEAQRAIYNLKDFMKNEHYGSELIAKKVEAASEHNEYLMSKVVKRLQIPRANRRAMIKVMEHWKMWIKIKRLFKYHMIKANDSMTPIKADLRWCFNQWRKADRLMFDHLQRNNFAWLETRNVGQAKVLDVLADREAENSAIISHLNMQRDELLENFLKAQKLALALLNDNHRKARERAWRRWKLFVQIAQKGDGEAQIYQSVDEIQRIKARTAELEKHNDHLAKENADLRQFSIDGFTIAKNVQQLSDEREKLSADLADKSDTVAELLAQNQMLRKELKLMGITPDTDIGRGGRLQQNHIRYRDGQAQNGTDVM